MTEIVWDAVGERHFEVGIDRGVLYLADTGLGVVWNGLTSIEERNDETTVPLYQDGVKYLDAEVLGNFAGVLKAFTYPAEFEAIEGFRPVAVGLAVHDQPPKRFHLSYRTKIGDDIEGSDYGYQIHILYNLTAVPNDTAHNTLTDRPTPTLFSWNIFGVPMMIEGFRPTAHIIIDSRDIAEAALENLEDFLYGTAETDPQIPLIQDLVDIGSPIFITDHGDGTWSATGPDEFITMLDADTFQIEEANADYLDPGTYEISNS